MTTPRPKGAEGRGTITGLIRGFRRDLLSALPERLYRAWMAEFRNPLIHSFFCNDPALLRLILQERAADFPKSNRMREGLTPLLGNGVFISNGEDWARQRRITDPAFDGGRVRASFPAIRDAARAAAARLQPGVQDVEPQAAHAAADVIFRALSRSRSSIGLPRTSFMPFAPIRRRSRWSTLRPCCPCPAGCRVRIRAKRGKRPGTSDP